MSHAAKAFESCDRSFKPVFADPKPQKSDGIKFDGGGRGDIRGELRGSEAGYGGYSSGPITPHINNHHSPFDAISYSKCRALLSCRESLLHLMALVSGCVNCTLQNIIPGAQFSSLMHYFVLCSNDSVLLVLVISRRAKCSVSPVPQVLLQVFVFLFTMKFLF